jgi:wyosine [tRNA(Phe)-imidazoG37] synthetase (radical SAM superfamily)
VKKDQNSTKYQYIYGPVPSWRIGSSLGIDLLSRREKICSFDCVYCQLGRTKITTTTRQLYVHTDDIMKELNTLPEDIPIDYLTISGRGAPTLAKNLGNMIKLLKKERKEPVAVITNSSLLDRLDVREELSLADFVIAKLDACYEKSFLKMNKPVPGIRFENFLEGIKIFKKHFPGKMALQIMFIESNIKHACAISEIAREINPDEVQINTPLRPCAVNPLSREELVRVKDIFGSLNILSVYESSKKQVKPISDEDTLRRRGKT